MAAFGPMRRAAGAVEGCLAMLRQAQHDMVDNQHDIEYVKIRIT